VSKETQQRLLAGLYRLASAVCPPMCARGTGTLLVTSATASVRGSAGQHSHAAAMGGRRMLCQTLNAEFAPKGIHVAHVIIDGAVDAPDTLGKMLGPERFQLLRQATCALGRTVLGGIKCIVKGQGQGVLLHSL